MTDSERRIKEEMARLHRQIAECSHCAACRGQMVRLGMLLPPAPVIDKLGRIWTYVAPAEEAQLIQRKLRELGL